MIRDPSPTVVAHDLQAALIRCGIKVEDKEFAYAASLAMCNLARAWLYGAGQIVSAAEDSCDTIDLRGWETTADCITAILTPLRQRFDALTAAPRDTQPWLGAEDRQIIDAVATVGPEGRDFCPRFGWGLNFPTSAEQARSGAVALDPRCALKERGCGNALLPLTGYAAVRSFPQAGWRAAIAGHGFKRAARASDTSTPDGSAIVDPSACSTAPASVPLPEGSGPRSAVTTGSDSDTRKVEGLIP